MPDEEARERRGARARPRPASDLAAAVGFLTLLPIGRLWRQDRPPRAVGFYPWVGWLLGAVVAAPVWAAVRLAGHAPARGAVLVGALAVGAWALLTRFLHWDGLADTFDGLLGGGTRERRLEIMHDSRIGSFGAAAIVMVALVQTAAIADFVAKGVLWPLLAAPVIGRGAASLAAWTMPAARRDGLGLTVVDRPGVYDVVVFALAIGSLAPLAPLVAPGGLPGLAATAAIGLVAAVVVPRLVARAVGGMTGDLFGATVLLVELVVLVTGAVLG